MTVTPPAGLRLIHLPDRLILHDITFTLKHHDPSNRNALIDAANTIHDFDPTPSSTRSSSPRLLDLNTPPTSPSSSPSHQPHHHRYLVLPFAPVNSPRSSPSPLTADSPQKAGIPSNLDPFTVTVDAAPAFLGLLPLHSAVYAVIATQVCRAGDLPSGPLFSVVKVSLLRLAPPPPIAQKDDKDIAASVSKFLESGSIYYSLNADISHPIHSHPQRKSPFHWNYPLTARLPPSARSWPPICIYGFVATHTMTFRPDNAVSPIAYDIPHTFTLSLISRRSRRRAGTRYITRGVDAMGDVANFVETEQVIWRTEHLDAVTSYLLIRGSIPIFWRQLNGIARPVPEIDSGLVPSRRSFATHFGSLAEAYHNVCAVSLVDKHGAEGQLANAYDKHLDLYLRSPALVEPAPQLVSFDFHTHCAGKEYESGLATLMQRLRTQIDSFGFSMSIPGAPERQQSGVFRVNCVDCLDRTNVVQTMIARRVLSAQLHALFPKVLGEPAAGVAEITLYTDSEDRFKHMWGDNADAVSKQYAGTGAMKTDFTRTGKRSTTGVIGDGVKSVMRMYNKIFVDESRQELIDILCGNAVIRQQSSVSSSVGGKGVLTPRLDTSNGRTTASTASTASIASTVSTHAQMASASLWYSFEAMRINAGGDKQAVYVELYDEVMYVSTSDGVCFEYPRDSLLAWSKLENTKLLDKRTPAKLRLLWKASYATPATTYPLDLQFRGGATMRENFLRALVSWARPEPVKLLTGAEVRVCAFSSRNAGEHRLLDWGLNFERLENMGNCLIALVVSDCTASCRRFGLAAVPLDIDKSNLVLLSAIAASERGPAIAILASKGVAKTTMRVNEAVWTSSSSFAAGGVAAVGVDAAGVSFCFIGARVDGNEELSLALSGLKFDKGGMDVSVMYDHVILTGAVGSVDWSTGGSREWVLADDGGMCYTLGNGVGAMRYSLPMLRYDDCLNEDSVWNIVEPPSRQHGQRTEYLCVADGVVDGGHAPRLPKKCVQSVVRMWGLRAERLRIPKGVEAAGQMTCAVAVGSELAGGEAVWSRPTARGTTEPEWGDELRILMMPGDMEEVMKGFVTGAVVVTNVIGDAIVAGYFVVPLSGANDGGMMFDVVCRLAGRATGKVCGRIAVDVGDRSVEAEAVGAASVATAAEKDTGGEMSNWTFGNGQMTTSASTPSSGRVAGGKGKSQMDEVNERLDAARRKGAKQMKSMVSKLSSLLTQPTTGPPAKLTSAGGARGGGRVRSEQFGGGVGGGGYGGKSSVRGGGGGSSVVGSGGSSWWEEDERGRAKRASAPIASSGSRRDDVSIVEFGALQSAFDVGDAVGGAGRGASGERAASGLSGMGVGTTDGLLSGLRGVSGKAGKGEEGRLQEAAGGAGAMGVDALLQGLQASSASATRVNTSSRGVRGSAVTGSGGASNERDVAVDGGDDDDGWGAFESAGVKGGKHGNQRNNKDDLIQW